MTPLVGTDLDGTGATSHSGFIDVVDGLHGVRGWAVNLDDPADPVLLQLCIGTRTVAETFAASEREDISAKLGRLALAGFQFDHAIMLTLPDFLDDPDEVLSVRIAATGHYLSSIEKLPTAAEILARHQTQAAPEPTGAGTDLETLLEQLQSRAAPLVDHTLRPLPESLQGYIETLAVDAAGHVWFMGWMRRGHVQEFSAVVLERRKYPAAVAVMSYARDDLPQEACGVVGLIASPWRPTSASSELLLFFGDHGRFHLRSNDPLRIVTSGELVSEYEGIRERCLGDGRMTTLQRMLAAMESWLPSRSVAQGFGTETSIDRVLMIPGLGCLVEGWVLSPMKRIEGLRLRIGSSIMSANPESLFWKPRLDLLSAYPGSERMVRRAGLVGLFVGTAEPEDFADPMLKVVFEGGSSANWSVPARNFRRLGHSASVEDALLFFPALQDEAFFPAFARAAIAAERGSMNRPVPIAVTQSRRAAVIVLPDDRGDMFLLFEELAQLCRQLAKAGADGIEALAFVASSRANRSDALWLFREFQAAYAVPHGIACSLLVIDDASQALDLLPDMLRDLGISRFLFAASGVFLNEAGWARAVQALSPGATDLIFFGIEAEEFERRPAAEGVTARCFAWSTSHFTRWAQTAPAFMGGFYRDNTLLRAGAGQTVHHNMARLARAQTLNRITEAVNASVYAEAAAPPRPVARPPAPRTPATQTPALQTPALQTPDCKARIRQVGARGTQAREARARQTGARERWRVLPDARQHGCPHRRHEGRADRDRLPHPSFGQQGRGGDRGVQPLRGPAPHRHRRDLRGDLSSSERHKLLLGSDREFAVISDPVRYDHYYQLSSADVWRQLKDILVTQEVRLVNFHHFLQVGANALRAMATELDIPYAVTFHEFLAICAHHGQMVTRPARRLCQMATPAACATCFPEHSRQQFAMRKQLLQSALLPAVGYISPSHFLAERMVAWGLPREKFVVIENGLRSVEKRDDRARGSVEGRPWTFGYFGQITPFKGIDTLLDTVDLLARQTDIAQRMRIRVHGNVIGQDPAFETRFQETFTRSSFATYAGATTMPTCAS